MSSDNAAESGGNNTERVRPQRQRQTRLDASQVDDLVLQQGTGATITELAAMFNIHRTTVMAHLRRRGGWTTS